jgi:uncharacterized membrane protein YfcA
MRPVPLRPRAPRRPPARPAARQADRRPLELRTGGRAEAGSGFNQVRKKVLAFSLLGLLLTLPLLAIFEPSSMDSARMAAEHLLLRDRAAGTTIDWSAAPALVGAGLAAGLLAGMLGMGGGVLKVSCMLLLLRMDIFFARAVSLFTMFFSTATALWQYLKDGLVTFPYATPMVLMALPGAVAGALLGNQLRGPALTHMFGVFMLFLAFNTLALTLGDPSEAALKKEYKHQQRNDRSYHYGVIGALHGTISGILGISGGVLATPLQQIVLHVPVRRAIANTLLASVVATGVAGTMVLYNGVTSGQFRLAEVLLADLFMGTGATVGASVGVRLGKRCNVTILRLMFVVLTLVAGISILF